MKSIAFFRDVCYNERMSIFAVSDLHLSFNSEKPMDVFGAHWEGHFERIKKDWLEKVTENDAVLIAGDISWAMKLQDGAKDLERLAELPGTKIFIRGNHDFWWNGIGKLRALVPDPSFVFLQTDCTRFENYVIVGSRGWSCPGSLDYSERDQKLYLREAERFRLAFAEANKIRREGDTLVAMIHYPPFNLKKEPSLFTTLFEKEGVDKVVFGHLHGETYFPMTTEKNGITYHLTSCDKTAFRLIKIY